MKCEHLQNDICKISSDLAQIEARTNPSICSLCSKAPYPKSENRVTRGNALKARKDLMLPFLPLPPRKPEEVKQGELPTCLLRTETGNCQIVSAITGKEYIVTIDECNLCVQTTRPRDFNVVTLDLAKRHAHRHSISLDPIIGRIDVYRSKSMVGNRVASKIEWLIRFFPFLSKDLGPASCKCGPLREEMNNLTTSELKSKKKIYALSLTSNQLNRTPWLRIFKPVIYLVASFIISKSIKESENDPSTKNIRNQPSQPTGKIGAIPK